MPTRTYPGGRLSSGQVALMIPASISFVREISEELLPYEMVGNRRRYKTEDVEAYLEGKKRP
jgi:hypothetical protein